MPDRHARLIETLPAALASRDRGVILDLLSPAIAERAPFGAQWAGFAQVLLALGELSLAWKAFDIGIEQQPSTSTARFDKAVALAEHGRARQAIELVESLPDGALGQHQRAHFLGVGYSELGLIDRARVHLERAVDIAPASGQSWLSLAVMTPMDQFPDLFARLTGGEAAMGSAPDEDRAKYDYALSKAFDDVGEHDRAFDRAARGASRLAPLRPYNGAADQARVEQIIAAADSPLPTAGGDPRDPILILGVPRSGTTLVEQILSRHRDIGGGGEANLLGLALSEASGAPRSTEQRRTLYLHLLDERFGGGGRKIDKSLGGSRLLGQFSDVFPAAPIVWLRRRPADVAWSNYRTFFARGMNWTLSLATIAEHMRLEDRLFDHWRDRLGDRILTVDYERLASQPDQVTAAIARHCGLASDGFAAPDEQLERAVTTASVAQVRAPIHRDSIGAAAPYEHLMAEFFAAYS